MAIKEKRVKEEELIRKKINNFYTRNNITSFESYPSLAAYVVFNRYQDKMKIYEKFNTYN